MGLLEAAGNRVLFDPQLSGGHHLGLFRVFPPREIEVAALQPDLIVVTHRHPDHFDLPSLATLARAAPGAILVTPDALVARAGARLGLDVCVLPLGEALPLDGLSLWPTPSHCPVNEWGVIAASEAGTFWNQVDTELRGPAEVGAALADAAAALGVPGLVEGPDLAQVRWQPMLEVEAFVGRATGFPMAAYARQLEVVAATRARAVLPGASGSAFAGPALDHLVFPLSEARFLADLGRRCPGTQRWPLVAGARFEIGGGARWLEDVSWVRVMHEPDPRGFRPWWLDPVRPRPCAPEPLRRWLEAALAPAVAAISPAWGEGPLSLSVDAPGAGAWTLRVDGEVRVEEGFDPEYDAAVQIGAADWLDVIEGRAHWGRALLGGQLRATSRAWRVDGRGLHPLKIAPIFLYYGLPYEAAFERWVEGWLAAQS